MNARVRSLCRSSTKRKDGFQRYLRPGALAQLRDSRISARSQTPKTPSLQILVSLYAAASSASGARSQGQMPAGDGFPCFSGRICGPRFPQRKKLVASKSVMFFRSSSPSSHVSDSTDLRFDILNTDLLLAH